MSKELETLNKLLNITINPNDLHSIYTVKDFINDSDLNTIKKALTPPTEKEVCKHLNESFGLNRHNTNLRFIYDKESREFRMVSKNKVYRYISTKRQDDDAIALIDLDIDDIAILGRFFENESEEI